jgi:hypothetical protein
LPIVISLSIHPGVTIVTPPMLDPSSTRNVSKKLKIADCAA